MLIVVQTAKIVFINQLQLSKGTRMEAMASEHQEAEVSDQEQAGPLMLERLQVTLF